MRFRKLKIFFLTICKRCGLFALARFSNRSKLLILAYHGFSTDNESVWASGIIMHPETLDKRLGSLKEAGYTFIGLEEALEKLARNTLPPLSVVITVDDGFRTTYTLAHEIFKKYAKSYTVYLTTYYSDKDIPIVNLLLQYALWRTKKRFVSVEFLSSEKYDLLSVEERKRFYAEAFEFLDGIKDMDGKKRFTVQLLQALGLDAQGMLERDTLKLLMSDQVRRMAGDGVDFQLHTHRHRFPNSWEVVKEELDSNAERIKSITGKMPVHLCYPSGEFYEELWPLLTAWGVRSATTTFMFLNDANTNPLCLGRLLDDENMHQIEFEANASGFIALAKRLLMMPA